MLPHLAVGQAQKHVTVNEALRRLDAVVQLGVVSVTTTALPASSSDGAVYIVPSDKSGPAWSAYANSSLGYYRDGTWAQIPPREGWIAYVRDTDQVMIHTGAAWANIASAPHFSATDRLLGRSSAGAGVAEEIVCTAAGRAPRRAARSPPCVTGARSATATACPRRSPGAPAPSAASVRTPTPHPPAPSIRPFRRTSSSTASSPTAARPSRSKAGGWSSIRTPK